jgi:hypothetical protein
MISTDRRRLLLYAAGLVPIYLIGVLVIIATHTQNHPQFGVLLIMFAPLGGALLARFAGSGVIRWGRLSWWMVAGLVPVVTVFGAYATGWHLSRPMTGRPVPAASLPADQSSASSPLTAVAAIGTER